MALSFWPPSLPQTFQLGMSEDHQSGMIRSPMSAGPSKLRKRFTATTRAQSGTMIFNRDQKAVFDFFFDTTIEKGSARFKLIDQADGGTYKWAFIEPPKFKAIAADATGVAVWEVSLAIERTGDQ